MIGCCRSVIQNPGKPGDLFFKLWGLPQFLQYKSAYSKLEKEMIPAPTVSRFSFSKKATAARVHLFSTQRPGPRELQDYLKNVENILYANQLWYLIFLRLFLKRLRTTCCGLRLGPVDLIRRSRTWVCCRHTTEALIARTDWYRPEGWRSDSPMGWPDICPSFYMTCWSYSWEHLNSPLTGQ